MLLAEARSSGLNGTGGGKPRGGSASAPVLQGGSLREREREAERKAEATRRRKEAREEKEEVRGRAAAAAHSEAEEAAAAVVARTELRREAEAELYSRATMVAKHLDAMQFDMYHRNKRMGPAIRLHLLEGWGVEGYSPAPTAAAAAVEAFEAATQRAAEWPDGVPSEDELWWLRPCELINKQ